MLEELRQSARALDRIDQNIRESRQARLRRVIGAILLTFLQSGLTLLGVSAFYSPLVIGIVVIAAATLMRGRK